MSGERISPPGAGEYAPFYSGYVAYALERGPSALLHGQPEELRRICASLTEEQALARYAPGKWSIKEVLGHLADTERVFSYRLFRIARGDATPLAGFNQNTYVAAGRFDERPLGALLEDFLSVRAALTRLVEGLSPEEFARTGIANEVTVSARALLYIATGHVTHHIAILRDSYGLSQ